MKKTVTLFAFFASMSFGQTTWTATSSPVPSTITGGPWTLNNGVLVNPNGPGNYCPNGVALNGVSGSSANSGTNILNRIISRSFPAADSPCAASSITARTM